MVADCSSGTEALRIINSREIDIVLLDLDLGEERGADFLESLRAEHFKGKVLLVTAGVNESDVPDLDSKRNLWGVYEARLIRPNWFKESARRWRGRLFLVRTCCGKH